MQSFHFNLSSDEGHISLHAIIKSESGEKALKRLLEILDAKTGTDGEVTVYDRDDGYVAVIISPDCFSEEDISHVAAEDDLDGLWQDEGVSHAG